MECQKEILTKKEAEARLKLCLKSYKKRRREKRFYLCPLCNGWHLTSVEIRPDIQNVKLSFKKKWKRLLTNKKHNMSTKVKCKCISKKETESYNKENPTATAIELQVPYDQSCIYYQLSGGTAVLLNTINKDAADMFEVGKSYAIFITPYVE